MKEVLNVTAEQVARIAHAAHREYCALITNERIPPWDEQSIEARESAIEGVGKWLSGEVTNPRQAHAAWMDRKLVQGWRYGANKSEEEKTHHCLRPWDKLPMPQRFKDALFGALCQVFDAAMGDVQ